MQISGVVQPPLQRDLSGRRVFAPPIHPPGTAYAVNLYADVVTLTAAQTAFDSPAGIFKGIVHRMTPGY